MSRSNQLLSKWTLRLDGAFLTISGFGATLMDIAGHFFGAGPIAEMYGSPHTIGGFEAHALAVMLGILLLRGSRLEERHPWHILGLCIHLLLGTANVVFWTAFVTMDVLAIGYVTTAMHVIFSVGQGICIWGGTRASRPVVVE